MELFSAALKFSQVSHFGPSVGLALARAAEACWVPAACFASVWHGWLRIGLVKGESSWLAGLNLERVGLLPTQTLALNLDIGLDRSGLVLDGSSCPVQMTDFKWFLLHGHADGGVLNQDKLCWGCFVCACNIRWLIPLRWR
eukprot:269096-Amphidinium_carterae.3